MRTRDLMQGDKVYETLLDDTPQVVTIEEVGQKHIYIGLADDDMALLRYESKYLGWDIEHIEPIPLTDEILEKNGWEKACGCWFYFKEDAATSFNRDKFKKENTLPFWVCFNDDSHKDVMGADDYFQDVIIYIKYVHELQHAIRLCGINDLADNFKVV